MRESLERASAEASGVGMYVLALYYFLANNFAVVIVIFGFLTIGFGATIMSGIPVDYVQHDVLAGMFGVWGASLIVLGVAIYGIFWANKVYARITTDSGSADAADATDSQSESETGTDLSL